MSLHVHHQNIHAYLTCFSVNRTISVYPNTSSAIMITIVKTDRMRVTVHLLNVNPNTLDVQMEDALIKFGCVVSERK